MRKTLLLLPCLLLSFTCFGQNALLDLYSPFYKSLTPLRTDSLFVRTHHEGQSDTREIAYTYTDSLLSEWRELHKSSGDQVSVQKIKQQITYPDGHKSALTESLDSINKRTLTDRFTALGNNPEQPDGYLMEIQREEGKWEPVQQTLFTYDDKGRVVQRLEQNTPPASSEWVNSSAWNYDYDSKGRTTARRLDVWADGDWKTQNLYRYEYQGNQSEPYSAVWLGESGGQLTPVDSTLTWYGAEGEMDSTLVFYWQHEQSAWFAAGRTVFANREQQTAQQGKTFVRNQDGNWTECTETAYTAGESIYTDEPLEKVLRTYDAATKEWSDIRRTLTQYKPLDEGRIYGSILTESMENGEWKEAFFAEAWFHRDPFRPGLDSLSDRSNSEKFTFAYSCGLPNPYVATRTLSFPAREDLTGNYDLRIVSEEGRMIYRRTYDGSGTGYVDVPLAPGFYLVTVSKGGIPVCSQKLVVQ